MDKSIVKRWIDDYVKAWRSPDMALLEGLFTEDIKYRVSPWQEPIIELGSVKAFWAKARTGPDEEFALEYEIVAIEDNTAVVRVAVTYINDLTTQWRDLWIITFNENRVCQKFEEWPFAIGQDDGQKI